MTVEEECRICWPTLVVCLYPYSFIIYSYIFNTWLVYGIIDTSTTIQSFFFTNYNVSSLFSFILIHLVLMYFLLFFKKMYLEYKMGNHLDLYKYTWPRVKYLKLSNPFSNNIQLLLIYLASMVSLSSRWISCR